MKGRIPRIRIEDYPAVKAHLDKFWVKIKDRADQGDTPYNLRNCAYLEEFSRPKISWASVGATSYSLIPAGFLLLDTNYFFATDHPEYLLILLNSMLITWWINTEDTPIGGGGAFRHYKYNLQKLSLPKQIPALCGVNLSDLSKVDEYDTIINKFFGLSEQEKRFIQDYFLELEDSE